MARRVRTDDGTKEAGVMPPDPGNGRLAGCRGICPGPHQLHGQETVGRVTRCTHEAS